MNNFIQSGNTLTLTAPYDVASGAGFKVGAIFAVAVRTTASGQPVEGQRKGVFELPKTSAQAWEVGQKIYWNDTNKVCTTVATDNLLIGAAAAAAANPSAVGTVLLTGAVV